MVKRILAWVYLVIAAVRGAFAIKNVVAGEGSVQEKIAGVSRELATVTTKIQALAAETPATWDDEFAETLKGILDAIAKDLLEDLEGKA